MSMNARYPRGGHPRAQPTNRKRVLLMGSSGAGKTSMRSMIFSNYQANDTNRLMATIKLETTEMRILNDTVKLIDCGGQDLFIQSYTHHPLGTFSDTSALILVIDLKSERRDEDIEMLAVLIDTCMKFAKDPKIFVMIHKIDLIVGQEKDHQQIIKMAYMTPQARQLLDRERDQIRQQLTDACKKKEGLKNETIEGITYLLTTIYNESLYSAWGEVLHAILETIREFDSNIRSFCKKVKADEAIVFERKTMLPVVNYGTFDEHDNVPDCKHRSDFITKLLKEVSHQTLRMIGGNPSYMNFTLKTNYYQVFFRRFTPNTYILVAYYITHDRISKGDCFSEVDDSNKRRYIGIFPATMDKCIDQHRDQVNYLDKADQRMRPRGLR